MMGVVTIDVTDDERRRRHAPADLLDESGARICERQY